MIEKHDLIKLSDSVSIIHEEMPDNISKKKSTDGNEDEESPEDKMIFNDPGFESYDKLFD